MRRMDWDTRKPNNVSRRVWLPIETDTYVDKHNDNGV
jgi:hypothetical protein